MDPCRRLLAFQLWEAYPATGGAAIRPPACRSHAERRQDRLRSGPKTMAPYDLRRQENALSGLAEGPEKMQFRPRQRGSGSDHSPAVRGEGTP